MDKIIGFTKKGIFIFLIVSSAMVLLCSCVNDSVDLGGYFKYDTEHQYISGHCIGILYPIIIKRQPGRKDIPPCVIGYKYDDDFIIAIQKPKTPLEQIYYDFNDVKYPLGLDTTYYWIIDKKEGCVNGPLTYTEFCGKCELYGIKLCYE